MKYAKTQVWEELGGRFLSSFTATYDDFMERLANGEELEESQKNFCDRYERLAEYFRPKLARKELVGDKGGAITITWKNGNRDSLSATAISEAAD